MPSADGRIFPPAGVLRPSGCDFVGVGDPRNPPTSRKGPRCRAACTFRSTSATSTLPLPSTASSSPSRPVGRRPGSAEFEIDDPPLRLDVFESPGASSPVHQLGIVMDSPSAVVDAAERFRGRRDARPDVRRRRMLRRATGSRLVDEPDAPLGGWAFSAPPSDEQTRRDGCSTSSCSESPLPASACCSPVGKV